jgi:hypothetical protein
MDSVVSWEGVGSTWYKALVSGGPVLSRLHII